MIQRQVLIFKRLSEIVVVIIEVVQSSKEFVAILDNYFAIFYIFIILVDDFFIVGILVKVLIFVVIISVGILRYRTGLFCAPLVVRENSWF